MLRQLQRLTRYSSKNEHGTILRQRAQLPMKRLRTIQSPSPSFPSRLELCSFGRIQHRFLSVAQVEFNSGVTAAENEGAVSLDMQLENDDGNLRESLPDNATVITSGREGLLQSFAETIMANVDTIIVKVDAKKYREVHDVESKTGKNGLLSKRWIIAAKREKRKHQRQHSPAKKSRHKMSVDELWEDVLGSAKIPFSDPDSEGLKSTSHMEKNQIQLDASDGTTEMLDALSPILGLPMDASGQIVVSDLFLESSLEIPFQEAKAGAVNDQIERGVQLQEGKALGDESHLNAILAAISLLGVTSEEEWAVFDARFKGKAGKGEDNSLEPTIGEAPGGAPRSDLSYIWTDEPVEGGSKMTSVEPGENIFKAILRDSRTKGYALTSAESNLLLAHLVTSTDDSVESVLDKALQVYREMKTLAMSGREECGPNAMTYRILILALSRRLMALGEAVGLCHEMMELSVKLTSEVFLDGMQACSIRNDLGAASQMMNLALNNDSFQPPVGAYLIMLEIMKNQNLMKEALGLFQRTRQSNALSSEDEDRLLVSLCRWPARTRRGDSIDSAPLLLEILDVLDKRMTAGAKPALQTWTTLVDQLYKKARSDKALWSHISKALKTVLNEFQNSDMSVKLLRIGLEASQETADADLASEVIRKEVTKFWSPNDDQSSENDHQSPTPIPYQVFRRSLETCLQCGDTKNASAIIEAFNQVGQAYPTGARSELNSLVLLCYTRAGNAENAKEILFDMVKQKLQPSEDLFGAVLHSLVVAGRPEEAQELFRSMESRNPDFGMEPGISCFNAMLLTQVRSRLWNGAILVYKEMQEKGIAANPQTTQGLVLAYYRKGGRPEVLTFLENLLSSEASIDEDSFRLAVRVLLPGVDGDTDAIRKQVRALGESDRKLRDVSLDLIRSARVAQIQQKRPGKNRSEGIKSRQEEAWKIPLKHLLLFARASDGLSTLGGGHT